YELSTVDWEAINLVAKWLKKFRSATTQMSMTKTPMLSQTGAVFRGLQYELKEALHDLPDTAPIFLKQGLVGAHQKLSEYYDQFNESPLY
ncbi:hypothetical protein BDQ17DRAFT_1189887, partial [Cyathus striatus]